MVTPKMRGRLPQVYAILRMALLTIPFQNVLLCNVRIRKSSQQYVCQNNDSQKNAQPTEKRRHETFASWQIANAGAKSRFHWEEERRVYRELGCARTAKARPHPRFNSKS